jgi:hypothetical protein
MLAKFHIVGSSAAVVYWDHAARTFAGVAAMAGAARPTFVFAHVLMPHTPWFVDAACRPVLGRDLWMSEGWDQSSAGHAMLRDQVQCVNGQTLKMVRALVAHSHPSPIIIIQGDHGSEESINSPLSAVPAVPTVEQARERFRTFGAYYLPGGGAVAFPESTSVVNVLRYVFSYYFDANLPPVPNTMFYSYQFPYAMTQLDDDFRVASQKRARAGVGRPLSSGASVAAAARSH